MLTRRVVMMAFAVSFGTALSASAQTPVQSSLVGLLKQSTKTVTAAPLVGGTVVPTGAPVFLLTSPKNPPAAECGPRPPRGV